MIPNSNSAFSNRVKCLLFTTINRFVNSAPLSELCRIRDNSDQGCQFTSQLYIDFVKENGIRQSMDGKSRWADNIMIERWFRSFKYEEAYLTQYNNIREARVAIGQYIHTYNFERRHSALDYQTPAECYYPAMMLPYVA